MPPRKRRRTCAPRRATATAKAAPPTLTLPANLLAEIAARCDDPATVFRCAATCKPLRREILKPDFVRRVSRGPDAVVPSSVVGFLGETFALAHPTTPAAFYLARFHLGPFVSRRAAELLEQYALVASRRGLVVLRRREVNRRRRTEVRSELCVYDPMTDHRAFFPAPPDVGKDPYHGLLGGVAPLASYVVLTAADGIGCPFMLLAADMAGSMRFDGSKCLRVQTLSSDAGGKWGPLNATGHPCPMWCMLLDSYNDAAVVLGGGVVHWLMHAGDSFLLCDVREYILTYDVMTGTAGSIDLPMDRGDASSRRPRSSQLASSPDGKLTFLAADLFTVSAWVMSGNQWARHAEVDVSTWWPFEMWEECHGLELLSLGDQRSGTVFLQTDGGGTNELVKLDMETKLERKTGFMTWIEKSGIPYEVDLASRLSSMKPLHIDGSKLAMPPRKRRRTCAPRRATSTASAAAEVAPILSLPADLLAEIARRTDDPAAAFRCAATCKALRREILSPAFIHLVCRDEPDNDAVVPSSVMGFLGERTFAVVRPATLPAHVAGADHLGPFMSRSAAKLLDKYEFVTSRGGLAVLKRAEPSKRRRPKRRTELCVYDPMAASRTFIPAPPDVGEDPYHGILVRGGVFGRYVLLTAAADGVGCSFMLLAADMTADWDGFLCLRVQTMSSDAGGEWAPVKSVKHRCPHGWCLRMDSHDYDAVVLAGVVHWRMRVCDDDSLDVVGEYILTYDVGAATAGSIDPPSERQVPNLRGSRSLSQLASSPDGKLSLLVADGFVLCVWVLSGGLWARHVEIDMLAEALLQEWWGGLDGVELVSFGHERRGTVFMRAVGRGDDGLEFLVLDTETKSWWLSYVETSGIPYEVDIASRLSSMKPFF
ncbi:hypothetical protein ACP70R_024135 [Stipagrostis hirtigluma subsp. patula]